MISRKIIRLFVASLMILSVVSVNVSAATEMAPIFGYDNKFSRGVGNVCYFVDSTAMRYRSWINNAASLWEYNGYANPIYIQEVDSDYATHMDFYASTESQDPYLDGNTNAYTTVYDDEGNQISFNRDGPWFFAKIVVNLNGSPNQATMVHEMGHAFGLADQYTNPYSIMYGYSNGREVSSPQEIDVNAINYLYDYNG